MTGFIHCLRPWSAEAATARYGPYVTAESADVDDAAAMSKVIRRGVRAVICTGKTGALPAVAAKDGRQGIDTNC
jgi:hypothetical protein